MTAEQWLASLEKQMPGTVKLIRQVEREECARTAEEFVDGDASIAVRAAARGIADAIRERGA